MVSILRGKYHLRMTLITIIGNIRLGDYILIVDSDTRVPKDCLLDAVSEMQQIPSMAILQYASVS